jgi:hypothetical protein
MSEKDVDNTIALMERENENRRRTGKGKIHPINEATIRNSFLTLKRLTLPEQPTQAIPQQVEPVSKPLELRPIGAAVTPFEFERDLSSFESFKSQEVERIKAESGGEQFLKDSDEDKLDATIRRQFDEAVQSKLLKAKATEAGRPLSLKELDVAVKEISATPKKKEAPKEPEDTATKIDQLQKNTGKSRDEVLNALASSGDLGQEPLDDPAEELLRKMSNAGGKITIEAVRGVLGLKEGDNE